jgi:restriction system protein
MSELAVDAIPPASLERVQAAHGGDRLSSSVRGGCGVAEITTKRMGELVRGVFEVLMDEPEGLPASQVVKAVEERVPPTEFEQGYYVKSPNVRRFEKIVRFAAIGPVKAGWLVKSKGHWSLTDDGRAAYRTFTDPEAFYREAGRLYRVWKKAQPQVEEDVEIPEDEVAGTFEEAEESAWAEIRNYLAQMPPYDFQNLVGALLKAMGYHVLWIAPPGPDRGIDVIAYTDPLGTSSPRIKVQVKRQAETKIAVDGLRSFMAVLGDQDVGIFISAGGFTSEAERGALAGEAAAHADRPRSPRRAVDRALR